MIFKPFYRDETGCAAYVFGCGTAGKGAVVDPQERDVEAYAEFAGAKGLRITRVIDTHIHAVGALVAGVTADALGLSAAIWVEAAITFASGVVVALRMRETRRAGASGGV